MVGWHRHDMSLSKFWEIMKDREACSPWDHKGLDTTEHLNSNKLVVVLILLLWGACMCNMG